MNFSCLESKDLNDNFVMFELAFGLVMCTQLLSVHLFCSHEIEYLLLECLYNTFNFPLLPLLLLLHVYKYLTTLTC